MLPLELLEATLAYFDDDEPAVRDAALLAATALSRSFHAAAESVWYRRVSIDDVGVGVLLVRALEIDGRFARVRSIALLAQPDIISVDWIKITQALLQRCENVGSLRVGHHFLCVGPESLYSRLSDLTIDELSPCETTMGWLARLPTLRTCAIGSCRTATTADSTLQSMRLTSLSIGLADCDDLSTTAMIAGRLASRSAATLERLTLLCASMNDIKAFIASARGDQAELLPALRHWCIGAIVSTDTFDALLAALPTSLRTLAFRSFLSPPALLALGRGVSTSLRDVGALRRIGIAPHVAGAGVVDAEWEDARGALNKACTARRIELSLLLPVLPPPLRRFEPG